jgi:hypothetical protein
MEQASMRDRGAHRGSAEALAAGSILGSGVTCEIGEIRG